MSKRHALLARTAAAVTTMGAALTGAVVLSAAPASAVQHETNYTFQTSDFGTRVIAEQVNLRSDRTAWTPLSCTRMAGRTGTQKAAHLDTANPLVSVGAVVSHYQTYTDKASGVRAAVLGTNKIGEVALGQDSKTPVLTIDALKSSALSWVGTDGKFHAETGLTVGGISLVGVGDITPAVQQLLDAIQQIKDTISETGKAAGLDPVVDALNSNDGSIEIPGLGRVYLPSDYFHREVVKQRKGTAQASVKALRVLLYGTDGVEGGGDDSEIVIGRAWSRIAKAPAGVMTGAGYGISADVMDGVAGIGRVAFQPLPCWGTQGQAKDQQTVGGNFLTGDHLKTGNVLGEVLGEQFQNGSARAWTLGKVAGVNLSFDGTPETTLSIDALRGRVNLKQRPNGSLRPAPQELQDLYGLKYGNIRGTYIGNVTFAGESYSFAPGDVKEFTDSSGNPLFTIAFGEVSPLNRGLQVIAAHIYIAPNEQTNTGLVELKLGVAKVHIKKY